MGYALSKNNIYKNTNKLPTACTGIHGQSRRHDDDPDNPLNVRFEAKMTKYHNIAEEHGFLFIPAIFSYAGQVHKKFYDFKLTLDFKVRKMGFFGITFRMKD